MNDKSNVENIEQISSEDVYKLPSIMVNYIDEGHDPITEMVKPSSTVNPFTG